MTCHKLIVVTTNASKELTKAATAHCRFTIFTESSGETTTALDAVTLLAGRVTAARETVGSTASMARRAVETEHASLETAAFTDTSSSINVEAYIAEKTVGADIVSRFEGLSMEATVVTLKLKMLKFLHIHQDQHGLTLKIRQETLADETIGKMNGKEAWRRLGLSLVVSWLHFPGRSDLSQGT